MHVSSLADIIQPIDRGFYIVLHWCERDLLKETRYEPQGQ